MVFHEQVNDGNLVQSDEEWHVPLLLEEDDETGADEKQQWQEENKVVDKIRFETNLKRGDQNRFEATPPLRRSGRQTQFPIVHRENAFITSMLNVIGPSCYKEASQYTKWMEIMKEEYESILKRKT